MLDVESWAGAGAHGWQLVNVNAEVETWPARTCCSALPGSCGPMPVLMMRSMSASWARRRSSSYFCAKM